MSFELSNALASFQRYINKILAEKLDIFVIVYLHDILIYFEPSFNQGKIVRLRYRTVSLRLIFELLSTINCLDQFLFP